MPDRCAGDHAIYVAEVVAVPSNGKIVVITVCRGCDMVHFHEHQVAEGPAAFAFTKENTKDKHNGI